MRKARVKETETRAQARQSDDRIAARDRERLAFDAHAAAEATEAIQQRLSGIEAALGTRGGGGGGGAPAPAPAPSPPRPIMRAKSGGVGWADGGGGGGGGSGGGGGGGGGDVEDRLARIEELLEAVLETTGARQRDGSPLMAVFRNTISAMTDRGGERGSSSFSRGSRRGDAPAPAPAPELSA